MRFENENFTRDVTLDYNEFVKCTITDCTVMYHGGSYSLVETTMTNVRFAFGDAANNALILLKMLRSTMPQICEELIDSAGNATPPPGRKPN